jgi:hypothetical protein
MQKFKDIFYNTNDLIVALVIIALAAFLIWDRIGVILDYPEARERGSAYSGGEITLAGDENTAEDRNGADALPGADESGETVPMAPDADGEAPASDGAAEPTQYSLYVAYGETAAQIAQKLLDSGLIKDDAEFYDALMKADAATRLQAGTFIIAEGAAPAEIVGILTSR